MKPITRIVWILSLISLFTDMASEMLYPIMPIYLKSIGFSIILIGVLEGFAEAIAGLSKGYFGKLSDNSGRRAPFVRWGYMLSAISKPMMAIFVFPVWIFWARTIDRIGKGLRTGARDAMLSDEATTETKGTVFGFHRSMDTLGAVLGPLLALIYLHYNPEQYKLLCFIAFAPGIFAVILSFFLKDKKTTESKIKRASFFVSFAYWKNSPLEYKKLLIGLLAFALFNSSDTFLLLRAKQSGLSDSGVIMIYIFYNLVYALFAFPIGIIADKIGLKNIFIAGLLLFAATYFGMSINTNYYLYFILFFVYGIYAAATEGIAKAWISNITDKKNTATAIGTYAGVQSIFALLASSFAGLIWFYFGASTTMFISGLATALVALYIFVVIPKPSKV